MDLKKKTLIKVKDTLPKNLDEAIEILCDFYKPSLPEIEKLSENEFLSSSHFGAGMYIRNSWFLWWNKNHNYDGWPKTQPKLNEWFENLGIVHADDMSGIILTSFHRKLKNVEYNLNEQIEKYKNHWKEMGYSDGIPTSG